MDTESNQKAVDYILDRRKSGPLAHPMFKDTELNEQEVTFVLAGLTLEDARAILALNPLKVPDHKIHDFAHLRHCWEEYGGRKLFRNTKLSVQTTVRIEKVLKARGRPNI